MVKLKTLFASLVLCASAATAQVTITPLPTPPSRSDAGNFSARADAFLGALPAFGAQLGNAANVAVAAAQTALNAPGTIATSATSVAIGTGGKSFAIQPAKTFIVGQFVIVVPPAAPSNFMNGQIIGYNSSTGVLDVAVGYAQGSGTYAAWNVALSTAVDPSRFVQQGGGAGQLNNRVYIGWSGARLKAQVDGLDLGNVVFDSSIADVWRSSNLTNLSQLANGPGYLTGINGSMVVNALGYTPLSAINSGMVTNALGYVPLSGVNSAMVTGALGYVPYNSSNPAGFLTGISGAMVNGALGYVPYNSSNPAGFITGINGGMVNGALGYVPANKGGEAFSGAISATAITSSGNLGVSGSSTFAGVVTFAGGVNGYLTTNNGASFAGTIAREGQFYLDMSGGDPIIVVKNNSWLKYRRASDSWQFVINGVSVANLDGGGNLTLRGGVFQNGNPN